MISLTVSYFQRQTVPSPLSNLCKLSLIFYHFFISASFVRPSTPCASEIGAPQRSLSESSVFGSCAIRSRCSTPGCTSRGDGVQLRGCEHTVCIPCFCKLQGKPKDYKCARYAENFPSCMRAAPCRCVAVERLVAERDSLQVAAHRFNAKIALDENNHLHVLETAASDRRLRGKYIKHPAEMRG